jgi:hypothetical protein
MIKLIVTANDQLYETLSKTAHTEGQTPKRARDVLQGFEQASQFASPQADPAKGKRAPQIKLVGIVVDMSLHAADTLLETLHSRARTSSIPLLAVKCDGQTLPLSLRRLCTDILEPDGSSPSAERQSGRT